MKTTYPHISSDGGTVTIEARTMAEADAAAHEALGPGWSTKSVRRLRKGGVGGFFAIEVVELIAEPAGRSGNGNGVSDEMASAEDLLRELTHNGGAFATRLIDRLAEPLDDEMTIARLLATTDAPSRSDELARVMSQLGLDRVASDEPAASLAALPDAPTFSDHSGTSRTAELPVLDADVEIGACVDADLFRPQVVAPLLVVAAEGPVGTIETIASNGGRLVATNDRAPATSAPTPPAPAAAPPANITPAPDVAPTPSTAHAAEAVGAAIDVAVEPAPVAQPVAPEVAEPAAVTAPTQPPPPAPPPRPPQPPAWVEPSNPLLAPPAAGTAPVTEPIVKALGEPAMPLADTVLAPSVAEAPTDAIDRDFVIALALGQPDEINASIPDELPSFEPAPAPAPAALAAVSMDLPLAKINPFREQLAVADEPLAQHTARVAAPIEVVLPHAPRRDDALVDTAPTTPPSEPREDAVNEQTSEQGAPPNHNTDRRPRVAVTRRSARQDATLRDLAASAAHPSARTALRRDVLFGRRTPAATTAAAPAPAPIASAPDDDTSIAFLFAAAAMSSAARPNTIEPASNVAIAVVDAGTKAATSPEPTPDVEAEPQAAHAPKRTPEPEPEPEPEPATFRTLLAPRSIAAPGSNVIAAPIGSGWSAPALRALGLPEGMVAAAAALAPRDDAEWTAALMLACRDRFEAVPKTPMLMAGPQLAAMASALRLPLVEPGEPGRAAYVALETDDPDEVLATLDGRDLHLVVGGSWQELARLRPVVVSAAGPRFMLQALSVAHAWGVPLGWMGGVESVRLDAVTLALEIRSALGLDLEEVRHRTS